MTTRSASIIAAVLVSLCTTVAAGPAPWFQWRSKADGQQACSQTPLGPGWEKAAGPFKDSHCTKLLAKQ